MELRTTFDITPSTFRITYDDPVIFIGSCFASSIGRQFELGKMPVMINPSGTVYNPVSVCNTLNMITDKSENSSSPLYNNNGKWISFDHYTDFSSEDREFLIKKINDRTVEARDFISKAHFLFITFGTARVYRWKKTGTIVSNCHKIPASEFTHELMTVADIVTLWNSELDRLKSLYPELKVVLTISPVRHMKDGAHGNQVSKSVLFLAVEELLKHPSGPVYFPAYELLIDDLRDYRFYDDDMVHPSKAAVDYLWEAFNRCWFDKKTTELWREVSKITMAAAHRINSGSTKEIKQFAGGMIFRIDSLILRNPGLNLEAERKYFLEIVNS